MKFALVGAGAIAQLRKRAVDGAEGAEFAGVFDIDASKAGALAAGGRVFSSLEELADSPDVDAVVVSTPPNTHEKIAVASLDAGKHVLVEKPMANSLDACARMVAAARRTGKTLTVGFNHRYFPAIKEVRSALASGEIGKLSYVRGFAGHAGLSEFRAEWMYSKDVMGGGALMDNGIHMIDLVHHLMGPVKGVYGKALSDIWNLDRVEDNAFAILSGENGVVASLNASWTEWKGYHFYVEAYGSRGMARAFYAPMQSMVITMDKPGGAPKKRVNHYLPLIVREKLQGWQSTAVQTLIEEIADFMALAAGAAPKGPIARAEDGYRAIEIANAVYASSQTNCLSTLAESV
jgi:predicted dehydrogenase